MLSHIPLMIINWHHFNTLAHYSVANDAVVFLILYTQAPNSIPQNAGLSTSLLLYTDDNDVNYNFVLLQWHTLLLKTDKAQVAICFTQNTSAKHGLIGTEHGYIWRRQSAFSFCETKERCGSGGTYYFARHKLYIVNRYNNQRNKAWTVIPHLPRDAAEATSNDRRGVISERTQTTQTSGGRQRCVYYFHLYLHYTAAGTGRIAGASIQTHKTIMPHKRYGDNDDHGEDDDYYINKLKVYAYVSCTTVFCNKKAS